MARKQAKPAASKPPASAPPAAHGEVERIRALARAMSEAELSELEIDDAKSGLRLRLRRGGEPGSLVQYLPAPAATAAGVPGPAPASTPAPAAAPARTAEGVPFTSPMVGTFYRSASPDAESFVEAGSKISEETTLCIIEAMKVMNEIKAEMRGTVVEVLVQNGEPVEFGQPLFLIRPG